MSHVGKGEDPIAKKGYAGMDFTERQKVFLKTEFGMDADDAAKMGSDALGGLYGEICGVEIYEAMEADGGNGDSSERGDIAVELVDKFAGHLGYVHADDEEDDEKEDGDA
jgi:hypothetical protein